jgi:hypothetical protein
MTNRKLKRFCTFVNEEVPPPISPTNTASGANIAGLPPDLPPVPARRVKSNIRRRKAPKA